MELLHEEVIDGARRVLVVRAAGVLPLGSGAHAEGRALLAYVREHALPHHAGLVLDLTGLEYSWGDVVASWVVASPFRFRTKLVATGSTAAAIGSLLRATTLERVFPNLLHPTVQQAIAALG